jgi:pimeloyl-ACP methyl ester carboxylesterase
MKSLEYTKQYSLSHNEVDEAFFALDWKEWTFVSPHGYTLKGQYLRNAPKTSAPAALFVHGITWTRYGMAKYMKLFIELGWNVAAFDLARHGESVAPRRYHPSFGFYEKFDVQAGVDALRALFPEAQMYGLFGESLGAASVLEYAPHAGRNPQRVVDFISADCSFSSAWEELLDRYRALHIPNFIAWPAGQLSRLIIKLMRGFDFKKASPAEAVIQTDIPILFAHGMEDRYVPTIMSIRMASARHVHNIGTTQLVLIPGAAHAKGIVIDKERWLASVTQFIEGIKASRNRA